MEIKRSVLVRIVAEEVQRRLAQIMEAEADANGKKKKGGRRPETSDANDDPSPNHDTDGSGEPKDSPPPGEDGGDQPSPDIEDELPGDEEAASDAEQQVDNDADAIDADGDAGADPSGAVNDEITGKTVQSISIEPESQILPGAKEVVVTFNEDTEPLRVLVTPTGKVVFSYRGQVHDIP